MSTLQKHGGDYVYIVKKNGGLCPPIQKMRGYCPTLSSFCPLCAFDLKLIFSCIG